MFWNGLCQSLLVHPCQRRLILILSLMVVRVAGSHREGHQLVLLIVGRKVAGDNVVPDVSQSSSSSSSSVLQVIILSKFLDQWNSITSGRFVNMPVCAKTIFPSVRKVWVSQRHICLQPWWLMFPWCPSWRQETGPEFLSQLDIIFLFTLLLWIGTRIPFNIFSLGVTLHYSILSGS